MDVGDLGDLHVSDLRDFIVRSFDFRCKLRVPVFIRNTFLCTILYLHVLGFGVPFFNLHILGCGAPFLYLLILDWKS